MANKTIVIVSGYFAPLGAHHIKFFEAAKKLGDELWVIVNNDLQLANKKHGLVIQGHNERRYIVSSLKTVDYTTISNDVTNSVSETLKNIAKNCPYMKLIFANGGDRTEPTLAEHMICKEFGIEQVFNVGPPKTQGSSDVIKRIGEWYVAKNQ